MDRSPLLYVHVGLPVQPTKAAWWPWPWPFDLESGVRVTCDVRYICADFSLPRPLCSRLRPDVGDRQTVRQTDVRPKHRLIPRLSGTGHNKTVSVTGLWLSAGTDVLCHHDLPRSGSGVERIGPLSWLDVVKVDYTKQALSVLSLANILSQYISK